MSSPFSPAVQAAAASLGIDVSSIGQQECELLKQILAATTAGAGGGTPSGTAGGDLSGTYPNPTVAAIQGVVISGAAAAGKVLEASSSGAASWQTPATGIGGTLGATANAMPRANGTGGSTLKAGLAIQNDDGSITVPGGDFVDIIKSAAAGSGGMRMLVAFNGALSINLLTISDNGGNRLISLGASQVLLPPLPTSSAGLISGCIYQDGAGGALKQVP